MSAAGDRDSLGLLPSAPALGKELVMNYFIDSHIALSRPPEGPLAPHIVAFANWMRAQGYSLAARKQQVRIAACFSLWLKQNHIGIQDICTDHSVRFLRYRARHVRPYKGDGAGLRYLIDFLRRENLIPVEQISTIQPSPIECCARAYEQYLRETRALAPSTVLNYMPHIRCFLRERFGDGAVDFARLGADDVIQFVQHQAKRFPPKRAKLITSALRSFLHYLRFHGDTTLNLAAAVPTVANWSKASIPRAISPEQIRHLLVSIDRRNAMGRRDYAIVLLLARLGLRSSEVVNLELDDIDWKAGQLKIRGKNGRCRELPLPVDVGNAIAAYVREGRPQCTSRRVFLRTRAPACGFRGPCGIASLIQHALQRANINAPTNGAHQFRHGFATELLRQGASLPEIGDLLGHQHSQTTTIYAKVDLAALRTLALPWPGGVQ